MSWPRDAAGTKRPVERESASRSLDAWLLAASMASLAVVVPAPGHALLSHAFGTGASAVVINLVTDLGR